MTARTIAFLAAAALAAVPATAAAKPHGSDHPGKGKGHGHAKWDRADRVTGLAEGDAAPIAEEPAPVVEETPAPAPKPAKTRGHGRTKGKMTVFKGSVVSADAATGTVVVRVRQRNRWARVWRGEEVTFTVAGALDEVAAGDRVVVKARVARGAADDGTPIAALRLIDLTSPADEDVETPVGTEPEPAPEPEPVETPEV